MFMTEIHLYFLFLIISLLSFVIIRLYWLAKMIWETYLGNIPFLFCSLEEFVCDWNFLFSEVSLMNLIL